MSQSETQRMPNPEYGQYDGDDDRRRYHRRQDTERRQLIRFDLSHANRRSGRDRRMQPNTSLRKTMRH
jgi:hypothetical protein